MSAELSFSGSASEPLSLEDLRQNPYVLQFAAIDPKKAALLPAVQFISDFCKVICEGGEQS
ncbi:hypothetical protein ACSAZL_06370 [Methanosarcina sp. T3]|uniref:hypothetical protein n=1 Tax=Methanosarcina sp. T3 TaxID=3439062 RepID=UPI003F828088